MNKFLISIYFLLIFSVSYSQTDFTFIYEENVILNNFSDTHFYLINSSSDTLFTLNLNDDKQTHFQQKLPCGNYNFTIINENESLIHPFIITEDDIKAELTISYNSENMKTNTDNISKSININGYIQLTKYVKSPDNVNLRQRNNLENGDEVIFDIINKSSNSIFGYYKPKLFYGKLYKLNDNKLEFFTAGSVDFNVLGVDNPLMPQDTTFSFIPDFSKNNSIYTLKSDGNYRFIVYYYYEGMSKYYYQKIGEIKYKIWDGSYFELSYDFRVSSS